MEYTETEDEELATELPEDVSEPETDDEAEPLTEETYESYEEEPPVKAGKYRIFSLVLFLLTAGGLFLGLLGGAVSWLKPSYYFGTTGLNNSLLGFFFTRMRDLFSRISEVFSGPAGQTFRNVFAILAACMIVVVAVTSLVCLIVTFVSPAKAKKATAAGGTLSLLAYTLLFVWAYCVNSLRMEAFGAAAIDVPVAIVTLLLFAAMTVYSVIENGSKGLFGAGIYLFTVGAAFALFFPGSFTETHLSLLLVFREHPIYDLLSLALIAVLVANVVIAVLALPRKSRGIVRCICYAAQLLFVALLAVTGCGLGGKWSLAFFVNGSLLPSVILIVATLGALLLSLLVIVVDRKERASLESSYDEEETGDEPLYDADASAYDESEDETYGEYGDYDGTYGGSDGEMSDFEREMLSLTENAPKTEPEETKDESVPPVYARPAPAQTFRPVTVYTDPSTQYTYDPFINELTPDEKNEFGDLFIACKSGRFGDLPVYHIGGDNSEFFDKVWIRYGMYDMSKERRDKLFSYLRRYKSNR